jgi:hypothetical protein
MCLVFSATIQVKFLYPDLYYFWLVACFAFAVIGLSAVYYMIRGSKIVARGQFQSQLKPR